MSEAPRPDQVEEPATPDEELLEAESSEILSLETDASRIERIHEELESGFGSLAHVGRAVSVFGSARTPPQHPEYEQARDVSARLGARGFAVITGGGPGIMEAANRGARDAGALSIGLDIDLPFEQQSNGWIDLLVPCHYFFTRKVMFVRYASAFVAFPGGFGTLDEVFELLTLIQTDKIRHFPVVLFGSDHWAGLLAWMREQLIPGRISAPDLDLVTVTDDPEEVVAVVESAEHRHPRRAPGLLLPARAGLDSPPAPE